MAVTFFNKLLFAPLIGAGMPSPEPRHLAPNKANFIILFFAAISSSNSKKWQHFPETKVLNSATIGERKNMNLPGVKVDLPPV